MGPQAKARFETRPFTVDEPLYFMFAYYKSIQISDLRVFVKKRDDSKEEMIFEVQKVITNFNCFQILGTKARC